MNGLSSLLSNDLQRGYEAGLASLVPPQRMAEGGANDANSGAYEYVYDPETMTYTLVEKKKPEEKIAAGEPAGDSSPSTPVPTGKPSGKGVMADLGAAAKGLMGFISQGGILGAVGRGLVNFADAHLGIGGTNAAGQAISSYALSDPGRAYSGITDFSYDGSGGGVSDGGASDGVMSSDIGGSEAFSKGGVAYAAKGMSMEDNSFILPADVVAAMGNGSSQAGLQALRNNMGPGVQMIRGDGDGMSDSIPANIAGTQPALISDGEAYVPPGVVRAMGGGDMSKGAKNLYAMMDEARKQAYGRTKQANQIDPNKVMTKAMKA